ncbi:DEAD/DEAH box helicase [Catenisphaera adipataccumulans]|uniref:Superfamily II DNA/RNA helicase n=1 Tax=Catenisphaera adipataccumulans TaxID=700500 RepID=A0A7W8CYJ0_9FIRM|nr:DEAD/DEAH box helicase [Catenisphaera adipataccumulans]MBB5183957.1 superfamily II DNA/RNA helicase [Catenisphaera adipataccumulans]
MPFDSFHLDPMLQKAIEKLHYQEPTPIQEQVIPILLQQKNCLIQAETGSGKTAAYAIPIIQHLNIDSRPPQAMVLAPTRELAFQIRDHFRWLGMYKKVQCIACVGQQPFDQQAMDIRQRCHVVTGTPGRILDHIRQGTLPLDDIRTLVLDEADALLEKDFEADVHAVCDALPADRTIVCLSATLSPAVKAFMPDAYTTICLPEHNAAIAEYDWVTADKNTDTARLLADIDPDSAIVFCRRQDTAETVYHYLAGRGVLCQALHGGMDQDKRFAVMDAFKQGRFRVLISTDVSARGIDIEDVNLIINYDQPERPDIYVHRIGRSGRAGRSGMAVNLIGSDPVHPLYPMTKMESDDAGFLSCLHEVRMLKQDASDELRRDITKIHLNIGKNKKIRAGDIVGAICSLDGLSADDIGIIQIQRYQSYVDILNGKGDLVLQQLKMVKHKSVRPEKSTQNRRT